MKDQPSVPENGGPEMREEGDSAGGISFVEEDFQTKLEDFLPSVGLGQHSETLKDVGPRTVEDLAFLRREDMDVLQIEKSDIEKLLGLGLTVFLSKEGLGACEAYIRSVGVAEVNDLKYLMPSDVDFMDLKQQYKDKLLGILRRLKP